MVELVDKGLVKKPDLLVLDESDRLMGHQFTRHMVILADAFSGSKTVLFSVQLPKALLEKAERVLKKKFDSAKAGVVSGNTIKHWAVISSKPQVKLAEMIRENPAVSIVFCATTREVNEVARLLKSYGLHPLAFHAAKGAKRRHNAVRRFKHGETLLVSTDLAARGVHFQGVKRIYSLGLPPNPHFYIHRAGRTGRMHESGECVTIILEHDIKKMKNIYDSLGIECVIA